MQLTFLYGSAPDYAPSKSYKIEGSEIKKASDYSIGFTFFTSVIEQPEDLNIIAKTLQSFAGNSWFRINGVPTQKIEKTPATPVRRLSENFPEQPTRFASFDIDGISISPEVASRHSWSLSDPESTAQVIRQVLNDLNLHTLAVSDFIFLLTSSQFSREKLNCHLYFLFEKEKSLSQMRSLVNGINTFYNEKVLDTAPYNPVQPDYIAPPKCLNFSDPIPKNARIHYSMGLYSLVPEDSFVEDIKKVTPVSWSTSGLVETVGANWLDTLRAHVGGPRGINEPAFRAAAQLVHEVGRSAVVANIMFYANQLHEECWKAIEAKGQRGDPKDIHTYNVERFKQYLESATRDGKGFGDEVDKLISLVKTAIVLAQNGDSSSLMSRMTLDAAAQLRARYPTSWVLIRTNIRSKLKGIITVPEFEKLLPKTSTGLVTSPITGEQIPTFSGKEEDLIRPLLSSYTFICDQENSLYLIGKEDKGVVPVTKDFTGLFYRDGLSRSGNRVQNTFGKKCLDVLTADWQNPIATGLQIEKKVIGNRVLPIGDSFTDGVWYNPGNNKTIKITPDSLEIFDRLESPIWRKVKENPIPTQKEYLNQFNEAENMEPQSLIDFYRDNILNYIRCSVDDLVALTSWLVTALVCRPLAYIGEFIGPSNCGKSTGADFAKDLVDPAFQSLGSGSSRSVFSGKTDEDFFALVAEQQVTIIDNIGILKPQVQDVLCQISTGLRYNTRILYTQMQMNRYIQKPLIMTGLSKVITRSDLISRTMTINFDEVPNYNNRLLEDWYQDKPFILAGLLHLTARAMKLVEGTKNMKIMGVSQRDIVYGAVSAALKGSKATDHKAIEDINTERHIEQLFSSGFCMWMFGFFQEQKGDSLVIYSSTLRDQIHEWATMKSGHNVAIKIYDALGEVISLRTVVIVRKDFPETSASFGWALSKATHAFNELSGWRLAKKDRKAKGYNYVFERRKALTDLF
jgi:hypothetical protein